MKRLHIHIGVNNLQESIRFYSALFGATPTKTKPDYAKWLLEDPHVNFAISTRAYKKGVDHLGIQVEEDREVLHPPHSAGSAAGVAAGRTVAAPEAKR